MDLTIIYALVKSIDVTAYYFRNKKYNYYNNIDA